MNANRIRVGLSFVVAAMCLVLALSRPHTRAVWIMLAIIFAAIGLRRRRTEPPANPPGA